MIHPNLQIIMETISIGQSTSGDPRHQLCTFKEKSSAEGLSAQRFDLELHHPVCLEPNGPKVTLAQCPCAWVCVQGQPRESGRYNQSKDQRFKNAFDQFVRPVCLCVVTCPSLSPLQGKGKRSFLDPLQVCLLPGRAQKLIELDCLCNTGGLWLRVGDAVHNSPFGHCEMTAVDCCKICIRYVSVACSLNCRILASSLWQTSNFVQGPRLFAPSFRMLQASSASEPQQPCTERLFNTPRLGCISSH